jgi:hypothetical protein
VDIGSIDLPLTFAASPPPTTGPVPVIIPAVPVPVLIPPAVPVPVLVTVSD